MGNRAEAFESQQPISVARLRELCVCCRLNPSILLPHHRRNTTKNHTMAYSLYDTTVPLLIRGLKNTHALLQKVRV